MEFCGDIPPKFLKERELILSYVQTVEVWPSGSIIIAIAGLPSMLVKETVEQASITPPSTKYSLKYSFHPL